MATQDLRSCYAQLMFYIREKYWHHAEQVCNDTIASSDDWLFRVWHAFCLDRQGLVNDALREYKAAEQRRAVKLPALMGMFLTYQRARDQTGMSSAEMKMGDDALADDTSGWVQAAALAAAAGSLNHARDVLLKIPESEADHRDEYTSLSTVRGWADLLTGRGALLEKVGGAFQRSLDNAAAAGEVDADAALGRVAYLQRKHQFRPAESLLNQVIVADTNCLAALVVKARLLMQAGDAEQAVEQSQRILQKERTNLDALALQALGALIKEVRYGVATASLSALHDVLRQAEPRNAALAFRFAQVFARLSGGSLSLLGITAKLADFACELDSRDGEYLCEVGYQQMYRGEHKAAITTLAKAASLTDGTGPLLGTAQCLIIAGKLDEAAQQVAVCQELQSSNQRNAELSLLQGMLVWRRDRQQAAALVLLDQAAEAVRQDISSQPPGLELYVQINLPVSLAIAREYMQHGRHEPPEQPNLRVPDAIGERCRKHLELLLRYVPGCMEGQLLLAKTYFVSGDLVKTQALLKRCVRQEQPLPETFLLSAQVCHYMGDVRLASQALEQALTLKFDLRDQPYYNLLHGVILASLGQPQAALEALQRASSLMNSQDHMTSQGRPVQPLSAPDHATLLLQLAQVHLGLQDAEAARRALAEAHDLFKSTTQAGRVAIAQAMLVARTDVGRALDMLQQVPPESDFFIAARTQRAKLFLVQRHNPVKYIQCFEEVVQERPSAGSFIELGEAYSSIQEPDKAIAAYERAQALDPTNRDLSTRIGRALVATHDYTRAVRYYIDALSDDETRFTVRADLAMLHHHLGNAEQAVQVLREAPAYRAEPSDDEDLLQAVERVNSDLLLFRVQRAANPPAALDALLKARSDQQHVITRKLRSEAHETVLQQRAVMASVDVALAHIYASRLSDPVKAKDFADEALAHDETNEDALLMLARLSSEADNLEECEQRCAAVRRANPGSEEAVTILADLLLRRERVDEASELYTQLLTARPNNADALVRYIELLRRTGRLEQAVGALDQASATTSSRQQADPGLSFARGLYEYYTNAKVDALRSFNAARVPAGNPWASHALEKMIQIYLVPTTEDLWVDGRAADEKTSNVRCAEQLLLRLSPGEQQEVLRGYCLVAGKRPADLQRAIQIFVSVAQGKGAAAGEATSLSAPSRDATLDEDDLLLQGAHADEPTSGAVTAAVADLLQQPAVNRAAMLGLAICFTLQKKENVALQLLQRVRSAATSSGDDDTTERALLLLAYIELGAGHYQAVEATLREVLAKNKSCGTAWDALGVLYEKQQKHTEASSCYQNAWDLVKARDPVVGYKLAFNYLKGENYVKAIDISKQVLAQHAAFPRIEEDIMEVAFSMLRP